MASSPTRNGGIKYKLILMYGRKEARLKGKDK
jgi:hypothetical protein